MINIYLKVRNNAEIRYCKGQLCDLQVFCIASIDLQVHCVTDVATGVLCY